MRIAFVFAALLFAGSSTSGAVDAPGAGATTFAVSFPGSASGAPLDGRIILLLSHDMTREPRAHVEANEPLDAPYIFGMNVDGMAADRAVVVDDKAFGWPAAHLSGVPGGDYFVQVVLNRYESFHLADGRTLKLPPDKGEGQQWASKPGNLFSKPIKVHIDAAHPQKTELTMDQVIAPIVPKSDTEWVKHIKIRSELLSKFWGRDVYIGAHVLLPKDFDKHPERTIPSWCFTATIRTTSRNFARRHPILI